MPGCCGGLSFKEHLASCEACRKSLTPLDDAWRCDRGRALFGNKCANNCGVTFGNDLESNTYSARTKGNTIFVCHNVSRAVFFCIAQTLLCNVDRWGVHPAGAQVWEIIFDNILKCTFCRFYTYESIDFHVTFMYPYSNVV